MSTALEVAGSVLDPELPVVTLADLGVLRSVVEHDGVVEVVLTPTYAGCPALAEMRADVVRRLHEAGYAEVRVRLDLDERWTTDQITARGRAALADAGISPPGARAPHGDGRVPLTLVPRPRDVACPRCTAPAVLVSEFGPTPCTAVYRCGACGEPFEHVKEV